MLVKEETVAPVVPVDPVVLAVIATADPVDLVAPVAPAVPVVAVVAEEMRLPKQLLKPAVATKVSLSPKTAVKKLLKLSVKKVAVVKNPVAKNLVAERKSLERCAPSWDAFAARSGVHAWQLKSLPVRSVQSGD